MPLCTVVIMLKMARPSGVACGNAVQPYLCSRSSFASLHPFCPTIMSELQHLLKCEAEGAASAFCTLRPPVMGPNFHAIIMGADPVQLGELQ